MSIGLTYDGLIAVALRKESVDRNLLFLPSSQRLSTSLSARRAWIEICSICSAGFGFWSLSARRAWIEINNLLTSVVSSASLSARRAWIEIVMPFFAILQPDVALRKESVDRNYQQ